MQHAYNEAINAWNADEVPVGAVIALDDKIIASTYNQTRKQRDPTAHAFLAASETLAHQYCPAHPGDCNRSEIYC